MDLDEDNEQHGKKFKNKKNITLSGTENLTLGSAKVYAPLFPKCRSICLRTAAVSTVIKHTKKYMENATIKVTKQFPVPCSEKFNISALNVATKERRRMML